MMQRVKAMAFSFVVVAVGAGIAVAGHVMGGKAREVRGWPTVEGKLLQADTKRERTADGDRVVPKIQYEYAVDGQTYTSAAFEPGYRYYEDRSDISRELNPFQEGATVTVYYNPSQPAEAYVNARPRGGIVVLAGYGVGLLGILMLIGGLFGVVKMNPSTQPPQR